MAHGTRAGPHSPVTAGSEWIGRNLTWSSAAKPMTARARTQRFLQPAWLKVDLSQLPSAATAGLGSSRHAAPALPCGNIGLAQDLAGNRGALWEVWKMAAPTRRTVLGLARCWRRFESPWSLGSRSLTLAAAPSNSASPWRLLGALCLQRPPLVSKQLTPMQEEMAALLQQVGWGAGCGF